MLLMKKPDDHLLFLKQSLYHAARRLDEPRVMIITPPGYGNKFNYVIAYAVKKIRSE